MQCFLWTHGLSFWGSSLLMSRDAPQWLLLIYSYPKGTEPSLLSLAFRVVVLYMVPLSFCPFQGWFIGAVGFFLVLDSINLGALGGVGVLVVVLGFFPPPLGRFSNAAALTGALVAAVTSGAYTRACLSCKTHKGWGLSYNSPPAWCTVGLAEHLKCAAASPCPGLKFSYSRKTCCG